DLLAAAREKQLPYQEEYTNPEHWIHAWGDLETEPGVGMKLKNDSTSNSAAVFLDGSAFWQDYRIDATTQLLSGDRYNLLARVENGNNYVGCSFERGLMRLFTVERGESKVLSIFRLPFLRLTDWNRVGLKVEKNTVQCLLNDQLILQNTLLRGGHDVGGIGFSVFSSDKTTPAILRVGETSVKATGR
ncbi:MAG: hypothetical protein ACEQSB_03635, partial [Undibacterium sp.]